MSTLESGILRKRSFIFYCFSTIYILLHSARDRIYGQLCVEQFLLRGKVYILWLFANYDDCYTAWPAQHALTRNNAQATLHWTSHISTDHLYHQSHSYESQSLPLLSQDLDTAQSSRHYFPLSILSWPCWLTPPINHTLHTSHSTVSFHASHLTFWTSDVAFTTANLWSTPADPCSKALPLFYTTTT